MSDHTHDQLTDEEIRAYVAQLREVPAAALIVQAFELFANAAQAKLGTPDARVLIDACERLVAGTEAQLEEAHPQIVELIGQLKMAQVQAERARGARGEEAAAAGGGEGSEPGAARQDQAGGPGDQAAGGGQEGAAGGRPGRTRPGQPGQPGQSMTDRLWIPGRD